MHASLVFLLLTAQASSGPELVVETGHADQVRRFAFSRDGRRVASAASDNLVKLWDVASGRELRTLSGHTGFVHGVDFSPDGRWVASASWDKTVRIWDVETGAELRRLVANKELGSVAFSPDGALLAAEGDFMGQGNELSVWNANTGARLFGHGAAFGSKFTPSQVDFSPDGKTIAFAADGAVHLWDVATRMERLALPSFGRFAFAGDAAIAICTSGKLTVHDTRTGAVKSSVPGCATFYLPITPDGAIFAGNTAREEKLSRNRTLRWDDEIVFRELATGKEVARLREPHDDPGFADRIPKDTFMYWPANVYTAALSPDGASLITARHDGTIRLWDWRSGRERWSVSTRAAEIRAVGWTPEGLAVARSAGAEDALWIVGGATRKLEGRHDRNARRVFSPDGGRFAVQGPAGLVVYDGERATRVPGPSSGPLAFSPDGKVLAIHAGDAKKKTPIRLYDLERKRDLRTFGKNFNDNGISSAAFSPDGKRVAGGSYGIGLVWDAATGRQLLELTPPSGGPIGHHNFLTHATWSPSGAHLAFGGRYLYLADAAAGAVQVLAVDGPEVTAVAFSPDGKTLVSGDQHGQIRLWDAAGATARGSFRGHRARVLGFAFHPGGRHLASFGADRAVRVWDVESEQLVLTVIPLQGSDWAVVAPDGRFDGSSDGLSWLHWVEQNQPIPLESFFDRFYAPGLFGRVLAGTPAPAIDLRKGVALPPKVRFAGGPADGARVTEEAVELVVEAEDQGGGVEGVRLYHNDKLVSEDTRGVKRASSKSERRFAVTLLPGANRFRAIGFNAERTDSSPAEKTIVLAGPEPTASLFILGVGVNDYENEKYRLTFGRPDAEAFVRALEKRSKGIFKEVVAALLVDRAVTRESIEGAFIEIAKKARPSDALVFYFAGHGTMDEQSTDFYLAPHDVLRLYGDDPHLAKKGLSARRLKELAAAVPAQKQLVLIDACQSGGAIDAFAMRGAAEEKAILQLARSAGLVVLASTGNQQLAAEVGALGHGIFTYALLEGLDGKADGAPRDGRVTVKELEAWLNERVPELTKKHRGSTQLPSSFARGQDFPLGVLR